MSPEKFIDSSERLVISEFTFDDAEFILVLVNTPSWIENIGDRNVKTAADAKKYLENGPMKSYKEHGFGLYKMELREEKIPIGMCGLIKRDTLEDVDIGFAILPAYEGKGFTFEAAITILNQARQLKLQRIVAITLPTNSRSINLLKKLNMKFECPVHFQGEEKELMLYSIQL